MLRLTLCLDDWHEREEGMMGKFFSFIALLFALGLMYLFAWPVPVSPVAWEAPVDRGYTGAFERNTRLKDVRLISLQGDKTPEDITIDADGFLYTGVKSGRILRIHPETSEITVFAETGGHPLGLEFDAQGHLIVADAYKGLLRIAPSGEITVLADTAEDGTHLGYVDDLDILPSGEIWFSDASTRHLPPDFGGTREASLAEIWEHEGTGRVLVYDPKTGTINTKMTGLVFSNGVAVGPEGKYVLVNETGKYRVLRYWLEGEKAGTQDVLIDNLPGFPDNINRDSQGGYFIGLVSARSTDVDAMASKPMVREILWRVPGFTEAATPAPFSFLMRIDGDGNVIETWQDPDGTFPDVTGAVQDEDGTIYVSSLEATDIAVLEP